MSTLIASPISLGRGGLRVATLGLVFASVLGAWGGANLLFDLCAHFRFQYLAFAAVLAIVLWRQKSPGWAATAGVVLIHNALALAGGYGIARAAGLPERDRRAVAFETGIQNSGLGLVLVFNFFGGLGGMAIVTAWWGIWHIVAGLTLATWWSRRAPVLQAA